MDYTKNLTGADKSLIINVIRRSLRCIDPRLIDHGERVAYITGKMVQKGNLPLNRQKLFVLSMLHDIGAYKTEEIDNMLEFETNDVTNHAVYGYVFLHNTTSMGEYAKAILHHHTPYQLLQPLDTEAKKMAALIYAADRLDILLHSSSQKDWRPLREKAGTDFYPPYINLLFEAEAAYNLSACLNDGTYQKEIENQINTIVIGEKEMMRYLKMLVYSIDFRSPFTVTHTANTTTISTVLGEYFAFNKAQIEELTLGAFLHDVGKIVIPSSILENPGKLNKEDMLQMRTHVTASGEILNGLVSEDIYKIAVRHHEKLNGAGYPLGLRGEELTLPQRIVAVADILSALVGRRSYKEPFPKKKTIDIIKSMRDNGELCPKVCNMVITHYDEIIHLVNLSDDPIILLYQTIHREFNEEAQKITKLLSMASEANEA